MGKLRTIVIAAFLTLFSFPAFPGNDFTSTVNSLKTYADVIKYWSSNPNITWHQHPQSNLTETSDNAEILAHSFWDNNGGVCRDFAGFMIYCMRIHKYKTGAIVYSWVDDDKEHVHIEAFVVIEDGMVVVTSNMEVSHLFSNITLMKDWYDFNMRGYEKYEMFFMNSYIRGMSKKDKLDYFGEEKCGSL